MTMLSFILITIGCLVGGALCIAAGLVWAAAEDSDEVDLALVFLWPLSAAGFVLSLCFLPFVVVAIILEDAVLWVRRWLRENPAPGPDEDLE